MKIISCKACGVVLDAEVLPFPRDIHNDDGSVNTKKAGWNGEEYEPIAPCPNCGTSINSQGEELV
ncbi:MAG: hypothetical protein CMG60_07745 [Candidatus Marinimicrobia bacterium]|nr:hypothetical protein [Candidatus Neomarinimicrobiota bacterium]|tara:strand:+ start:342 stop:536 length:195 start_codon:yes stop_codon:yes gene_type:complete